MFDDLSALRRSNQERWRLIETTSSGNGIRNLVVVASGKRKINVVKDRCSPFTVRSNDNPVRVQKVCNRRSLSQELRIGNNVKEISSNSIPLHGTSDPFVGVNGDRTLFDDNLVRGQRTGDLARNRLDVGEIGVPVFTLRGSYCDKDRFA